MTDWGAVYRREAQKAVNAYWRRGDYDGFPTYGAHGLCARAARCLWSVCHDGRAFPFQRASATLVAEAMLNDARVQSVCAQDTGNANEWHTAVGRGMVVPGAMVFFGGNHGLGHVVTVIDPGRPGEDLASVKVFENTSGYRHGLGPGTIISTMDLVCGAMGSDRVVAVARYEV